MNYYFLLEDEKSFIKVLPQWFKYLGFNHQRVVDIDAVTDNCYIMQSGQGVTRLIETVLYQTMDTILSKDKQIDYLVVILDAEEKTVGQRIQEVQEKVIKYKQEKGCDLLFKIEILVCNCCFETFLLGNREIYPQSTPSEEYFKTYYEHYNIKENDPELMKVPQNINETTAKYHFHYLHEAMRYNKKRYNKKNPGVVAEEGYFQKLIERIEESEHLESFRSLVEFILMQINNDDVV